MSRFWEPSPYQVARGSRPGGQCQYRDLPFRLLVNVDHSDLMARIPRVFGPEALNREELHWSRHGCESRSSW